MKYFFYYCNSYFPYSVLAAAMHLGIIPAQPPFDIKKLNNIPLWETTHRPIEFLSAGKDRQGNPVYALWNAGEPDMIKRIIFSFMKMYQIPSQRSIFLELDLKDNFLSLTAAALMRFPATSRLGEPLVLRILNKCYSTIACTVDISYAQNLTKTANYQIMLP